MDKNSFANFIETILNVSETDAYQNTSHTMVTGY